VGKTAVNCAKFLLDVACENYQNWSMFHGAIHEIKVELFMAHDVQTDVSMRADTSTRYEPFVSWVQSLRRAAADLPPCTAQPCHAQRPRRSAAISGSSFAQK